MSWSLSHAQVIVIIIILTIVSSWSFIMRIKDTLSQHKKHVFLSRRPGRGRKALLKRLRRFFEELTSCRSEEMKAEPTVEKSSEAPWKCSDLKCCCHGAGSCFWWSPGFYGHLLSNFTISWRPVQHPTGGDGNFRDGDGRMMWKPWKDGGIFLKNAKLGWKHWWLW